jgi:homoserine dehydrogenase
MQKVNIGLIGCGTVGTGVAKVLLEKKDWLTKTTGLELVLKRIADKNTRRRKEVNIPRSLWTSNAYELINDPSIDIVIELVGGTTIAKDFIDAALKKGKYVVTANKALLAEYGQKIMALANTHNVEVGFEASVGGGIPIIHAMRTGLAANKIQSIFGILNGTTNYILTKMTDEGLDYNDVLKQAQELGYAEANPTLDVGGHDAAHKINVLSYLSTQSWVNMKDIHVEGITEITSQDIQYATELGYVVKLLAIAKFQEKGVDIRVHPTMLPKDNLLTSVNGVFNSVLVTGDVVGTTMYYGRGAGMMPTASAVVSDIIQLGRKIVEKAPVSIPSAMAYGYVPVIPISEIVCKYYLRMSLLDRPGAIAAVANVLGRHKISIASVIQKARSAVDAVPVVMMTHEAQEASIQKALKDIDRLNVVKGKSFLIRVES